MGSKVAYQEKHQWMLIFLAASPLFMIAGMRYGIGTDYFSYVNLFRNASRKWDGILEPLYYLFNHLLNIMGLSEQWIFIVCSAIYVFLYLHMYTENRQTQFSAYIYL